MLHFDDWAWGKTKAAQAASETECKEDRSFFGMRDKVLGKENGYEDL
ncbi:hypothetical protein [Acutalibacter intestini]|nr:hypothetical protein [Acutalibacter sp. M00204]